MAGRRLVVCSDGTWNKRSARGDGPKETNVARVAETLRPAGADGTPQVLFYDEGVGVEGNLLERLWAGATGAGLEKNVLQCYTFLATRHQPGDEVFLFGFSRGAFTVRSTVGMVRKCGFLRDPTEENLAEAYRFYRGPDHPDSPAARAFRRRRSIPQEGAGHAGDDPHRVPIRFLGVWDTVGALGIPAGPLRWLSRRRHGFHDVALSSIVAVARHALAVDERRKDFTPTLWSTKPVPGQSVQQLWFAGTHTGVGGGGHPAGLPDVALDWMVREAKACGLEFDEDALARRVHPDPKGRLVPNGWAWSLRPRAWRPIGGKDHQPQAVSGAARERLADPSCGYSPPNLRAFLGGEAAAPAAPPRPRRARRRGRSPA